MVVTFIVDKINSIASSFVAQPKSVIPHSVPKVSLQYSNMFSNSCSALSKVCLYLLAT